MTEPAADPLSAPAQSAAGDGLAIWLEAYFELAVTTAESFCAVQRRHVGRFLSFMQAELAKANARLSVRSLNVST